MNQTCSDLAPISADDFNNRVSSAAKRGQPQWIWPEVSIDAWREGLDVIEHLTRQILSDGRARDSLQGEPTALALSAYTSGMGPLLGYWCAQGLLTAPRDIAQLLGLHYEQNSLRMEKLGQHARSVTELMAQSGIAVTVLKGMHTAYDCFPTPATRPVSDIDLFVAPADKRGAQLVLRELGYSPEIELKIPNEQFWRHRSSPVTPQSLTFVHANDPWGIDLHTSANRRFAEGSPIILLDDLIGVASAGSWGLNRRVGVMSDAANILFLACHAGCGFCNLRMLRLVELVLIIRKAQHRRAFSWPELIKLGEQTRTLPHAFAALGLAASLAPGIVPDGVLRLASKQVPKRALRVIERLTPASAHMITRRSIEERYMWTSSFRGKVRQVVHDFIPYEMPRSLILSTVKRRMQRLFRGTLSMRA